MSTAKRLLSLLLCLIMIFSMFACSNELEDYSDSASDSNSGISLPSQVPDNYVSLAEHERANFRIVYEKGLASAVTQKITKNLETLKTKIGVIMPSVDDATLPAPDGMPEILIGETNREVSKLATAKLRSCEYTITYDKATNSVVIAGGSASALGTAIDKFFKNVDNNKRYLAIPNNYSESKFLDFPIQSIVIDGVPIQEYAVVYPKDFVLLFSLAVIVHCELNTHIRFYVVNKILSRVLCYDIRILGINNGIFLNRNAVYYYRLNGEVKEL